MPKMTFRKSLLIANGLVVAAAIVYIGQKENVGIPNRTVATVTSSTAFPSCTANRGVDIRTPVYKRYLRKVSAGNYTLRRPG